MASSIMLNAPGIDELIGFFGFIDRLGIAFAAMNRFNP